MIQKVFAKGRYDLVTSKKVAKTSRFHLANTCFEKSSGVSRAITGGKTRNCLSLVLPLAIAMLAPSVSWASATPNLSTELPAAQTVASDPFPVSPALKERAEFWRNVYASWSLNQVALHDFEHPGLVYKVVSLPGEPRESFTSAQRDLVEHERETLVARLRNISLFADEPSNLNADDADLLRQIVESAGVDAVKDAYLRVRAQRGLRERFKRGLEISGRYDEIFRRILREQGVPEDLAFLPHVESSFQAHARSSAGAVGIWQFTRPTGKMFMRIDNSVDERLDPIASARASARYLRKAHDLLGDWSLAVTSYNHGVGGMMRAKNAFGTDFDRILREYRSNYFGFASKSFYAEFLAAREVAKNPQQFFPEGITSHAPYLLKSVVLDQPTRTKHLANRYGVEIKDFAEINPAWLNRLSANALLPAGLEVWLPEKSEGLMAAKPVERANLAANESATESAQERVKKTSNNLSGFHLVRTKDTLSSVSRQYDIPLAELRRMNSLSSRQHLLRVGQKLRIADHNNTKSFAKKATEKARHLVHVVRKGDNLFIIAANYGVSVSEVLAVNRLSHTSVIYPGQRFRIPRR